MKGYILQRDVKLLLSENLAIENRRIIKISKTSSFILRKLLTRPLWEEEFSQLPKSVRLKLLTPIQISYPKGFPLILDADYMKTRDQKAQAWKVMVKKKTLLGFQNDVLSVKPGHYFFPLYRPKLLSGQATFVSLKSSFPSEARDKWIIRNLERRGIENVLELGPGAKERLRKKLVNVKTYKGIDQRFSESKEVMKNDFTKVLPGMPLPFFVIAEEVIEHLPEKAILPLFTRLKASKASGIILTTPNQSFSQLIGKKFRHPDHKFEWNDLQLEQKIKSWKKTLECKIVVSKVGRKLEGIHPTWGIVMTFQ